MTDSQRAKLVAKRKKAYEDVHPETKNGGNRRGSGRQTGELKKDRFTADTAIKTGRSERSIQRDVTRANKLGPDLDRIAGTSLDTGAQIDALAKMTPEERDPIIRRAATGAEVRAIAEASTQVDRTGLGKLLNSWQRIARFGRTGWTMTAP